MIVLKSTYDRLFDLFCKEKHDNLDLIKENQELVNKIRLLEAQLREKR